MTNPEGVALYALCLAVGILPVIAFLVALVLLDSYKLVRLRSVLLVVALGGLVALISLVLNPALREALGLNAKSLTRYVAPIVEEVLKGLVIVAALRSRRIGFLVDAAIWGFAIGAGFAMVENTHYSIVLGRLDLPLWIIRGFGTAVMHGGTTAIMAVTSKLLTDRANSQRVHLFVPGLAFAILIHSAFNHFYLSPTHSALTVIVALPLLFSVIFRLSENATQTWLGVGFDTDQELLRIIKEGRVSQTQVGRYLRELRGRFAAETVVDMLCPDPTPPGALAQGQGHPAHAEGGLRRAGHTRSGGAPERAPIPRGHDRQDRNARPAPDLSHERPRPLAAPPAAGQAPQVVASSSTGVFLTNFLAGPRYL